jgi:ABC-type transporter lipoprotein component MlaA
MLNSKNANKYLFVIVLNKALGINGLIDIAFVLTK